MGLLASAATKNYLMACQNEYEYQSSLIREAKMSLAYSSNDLLNAGTDLDEDNPALKQLQQRKERLNRLERQLDMKLEEYNTKLKMIEKNIAQCDKVIDAAIK